MVRTSRSRPSAYSDTVPMSLDTHEPPAGRRSRRTPSTDAWVWISVAVLAVGLSWTSLVFAWTLTSDPCTWTRDQCTLALGAFVIWFWPQALALLPSVAALVILMRYAVRGNRRLPIAGMGMLVANSALSAVFLWYLTTLPFYFR